MRTGGQLVLGAAALIFAWQMPRLSGGADQAPVVEVGDLRVVASELTAEFAYLPPPLLQRLKADDNSARIFAVDWYSRVLFAKAAQDDGFLAQNPGLGAAAAARERDMIAAHYIHKTATEQFHVTDEEVDQYRRMNADFCRAPARYRIARVGVVIGRNASPGEIDLANQRFAEIEKRLAAGDDFAQVADERSDYTAKAKGGDMGWLEVTRILESPHGEVIAKLSVGERTPAIDTGQGKVVYKMIEREEARDIPSAECRGKVEQVLNEKYRKEIFLRRVDELAARFKSSMNIDAFIKAVRAVPLAEGWERTWRPEDAL